MELVKAGRGITIHIYGQSRKTLCGRQITEFIYYTAEASCKRCLSIHKTNTEIADHAAALAAEVNAEIHGGVMAQQPIHPVTGEPQEQYSGPTVLVAIYTRYLTGVQWRAMPAHTFTDRDMAHHQAAILAGDIDAVFAVVDTVTGEVLAEYQGGLVDHHTGEFLYVGADAGTEIIGGQKYGIASGLPIFPREAPDPTTGFQAREAALKAAYREAHQQATSLARIVGVDGAARFRARQGKRKPSNHRRGW